MLLLVAVLVLIVAVGAYAWGARGILPLIARDLVFTFFGELIPEGVASHPFSRLPGRWRLIGKSAAWMFFGIPIATVLLIVQVLMLLVLTPFAVVALFRNGRTSVTPDEPPPRLSPGAILALLRKKRARADLESTSQARVHRFRPRAAVS